MKSVIAFLLLIAISSQIERGDCADTLYGDIKEIVGDGVQQVKDAYNEYVPSMLANMPEVPKPVKEGYESIKNGMEDMTKGAGEMAKDTVNSFTNAMDYD